MAVFEYSAAQQNGAVVKGEKDVENEVVLARMLKQEGLFLLRAKAKGASAGFLHFNVGEIFEAIQSVSIVDRMFFARNLGVMIRAGLPLTRALDALG